ncbi:bifunctional nicotinamide-nucleotide adenylyltransferase/Nudix hydroxylase [Candidatus Thorarchaeota archaeon]|nr:MAG: bifunctional nicotinamide-nucleotide adenylyltransferase/Nudix hydroxylase [Candidatus Thorarchaeota archaeon]
MSTKKYDYAIFIGRFQPLHNGHRKVIQTALAIADKVIVVIGSADQPRTPKNPWTASERSAMIIAEELDHPNIRIVRVRDQKYNDQKWTASIQAAVAQATFTDSWRDKTTFCLIGHNKDESSYYLKMFPQWELVDHEMDELVSSTDLRALYFEGKNLKFLKALVPAHVYKTLESFRNTEEFNVLVREYVTIEDYKKSWEVAPYAPTFVTTDAVVVQSGHILLVLRGATPGEGQWALPGGFLNQAETMEDGMIRELREETKLKVPAPVLKGSIKASKVFDYPSRSLRGRTITNAFLIELPSGELPKVKGGDDAKRAKWFPIAEVKPEEMFEDHFDIISYFLGRV